MLAVNYSTIRNNLKDYCDQATDNHETVIVTRKGEKNVVIMSLEKYNQLEKAAPFYSDFRGIKFQMIDLKEKRNCSVISRQWTGTRTDRGR